MHIDKAIFRVSTFAQSEALFAQGDHLLLAVSGGRDSMCMLSLFVKIGQPISVAHMNYSLRGSESDQDASFVEAYCAKHDITFHVNKVDCRSLMEKESIGLQEAARNLRYHWMQELLEEFDYSAIATAHHQDDNVETFFINLFRGTGIQGLTGIPIKREDIIRPMMCFTGAEVVETVEDASISYREDTSNSTDDYLRNKIRHHVVPLIDELKPGTSQILIQNIERIKEQWLATKTAALKFGESCCVHMNEDGGVINIDQLSSIPSSEHILLQLVSQFGFNLDQCASLLYTEKSSGTYICSSTHEMIRDRNQIKIQRLSPASDQILELAIGECVDCETGSIAIETATPPLDFTNNRNVEYIFCDSNDSSPFKVRNWQHGDRLIPIGMTGHQKVSDILTNLKYSTFQKRNVKVLLKGDNLVWIVGVRLSSDYKVDENSNEALKLIWTPSS